MLLRSLLVAAALAALAAAPASAAAPSLDDLKPCYVAAQEEQRELVLVNGSGFTAGKVVDDLHRRDSQQLETRRRRTSTARCAARSARRSSRRASAPFTLRVTERDNGAQQRHEGPRA